METIIGQKSTAAAGGNSGLIKDATAATFMADVVQASMQAPVLVDFWAPWCQPCKQLTPALEKVVTEAKGAVRLVKVNIDDNQMIAQQLRIQSVPTVLVFHRGQPVDGFQGAVPESQLKQFVQALIGPGADGGQEVAPLMEAAERAFEAGDMTGAAALFAEVLKLDPANPEAIAGLAHASIRGKNYDQARAILARAPKEHENHTDIVGARAALALAEETKDVGDVQVLLAKLTADPDNLQARYDLALALTNAGDHDGAANHLLDIIRRNRAWNDEAARKQLIKMFEAMGPTSPFTLANRRRLSSLLFS